MDFNNMSIQDKFKAGILCIVIALITVLLANFVLCPHMLGCRKYTPVRAEKVDGGYECVYLINGEEVTHIRESAKLPLYYNANRDIWYTSDNIKGYWCMMFGFIVFLLAGLSICKGAIVPIMQVGLLAFLMAKDIKEQNQGEQANLDLNKQEAEEENQSGFSLDK